MNGGDGEGRRLLVGVVQLVEVLVQPWPVKDPVAPVGQVVLKKDVQLFSWNTLA